ncbi:hypothetical protein EV356DRAFT_530827 [Viridothelium virens]|uniref:Potassium channel tetramerisation-type BTB domain-containing protein n=1 Tax=Viridothelium virens TaxID=1048519 RepID=A0A6A6HEI3_VIRVR|nr:hypothetical protein EV356DRAFT_530827 [Viridothelium virens]
MDASNQPIQLQVGERRFTTTRTTLDKVAWFAAFLKPEWDSKQPDGSYFLDADPDTFEHILRYLRHETFPLFYNQRTGFDYWKYNALVAQADYFCIEELVKWIKEQKYVGAVQTTVSMATYDRDIYPQHQLDGNSETEHHFTLKTMKVYVCPRGISSHEGDRRRCGRQCENANTEQGGARFEEQQVLRTTEIIKTTNIRFDKCQFES